ncbi:MAG: hypothetical protein ACREOW_08350, partial [Thermodesulfobacteriota bacterium]
QEVSLLAELPPGDDAIGEFVIALLDAEGEVAEVNEENNEVVSSAIVGEGGAVGGNGGCSVVQSATPIFIPLYLLVPVIVLTRRLWRRYRI